MNFAKNRITIGMLSFSALIASSAVSAQTSDCAATNQHHRYTPPAWVAEMRKNRHQPSYQRPAFPFRQPTAVTPGFPAYQNFAPVATPPTMPSAWRNQTYPYHSYNPWGNHNSWNAMDNMMNGAGNGSGNGNMNFSFGGNMSGRGYGNGRNSYQNSWWDAPLLPIYSATETTPKNDTSVETAAAPSATPLQKDDDKDGVFNLSDLCANTPAGTKVNAFGCADKAAMILRGVNFHTNSDKLTDASVEILDRVVNTLKAHPEVKLEVSGHTDSRGDDAYNKDLSERRAISVRRYLVDHGVLSDNLTAKGYGEERPIASNDTSEGMAQNRRVELNRLDK